jgi:hypothetical protein
VKFGAVLSAGVLLATSAACSFSASSRSSSRSSSASSRSSSGSSSGDGEKENDREKDKETAKVKELETIQSGFQEEIAAIAVLYVGSNGSAEDFQRDISAAAKRNGIPYWELDERVFRAIGVGVKRAGVKAEAVPALGFLQGVRNAKPFDAVLDAYGREH